MKRILYLFYSHRRHDARLLYREIYSLEKTRAPIVCYALDAEGLWIRAPNGVYDQASDRWRCVRSTAWSALPEKDGTRWKRIYRRLLRPAYAGLRLLAFVLISPSIRKLELNFVQASHVRELPLAFIIARFSDCRVIYDAHEDYVRQMIDFSRFREWGRIRAQFWRRIETALSSRSHRVFCTDENIQESLRERGIRADLMRNFPPSVAISEKSRSQYHSFEELQLVYIGSVNKYRGIVECAKFVARWNAESDGLRLSFTYFGQGHALIDDMADDGLIVDQGFVPYENLRKVLAHYDVGVCMWQRLPKFERNLPLKNFDYMAAGMPIITSDFGLLRRYAERSGAALCIDPSSYGDFRRAIEQLRDEELRERLGDAGRKFVSSEANFDLECRRYVESVVAAG